MGFGNLRVSYFTRAQKGCNNIVIQGKYVPPERTDGLLPEEKRVLEDLEKEGEASKQENEEENEEEKEEGETSAAPAADIDLD